jgi:hypothetical protein
MVSSRLIARRTVPVIATLVVATLAADLTVLVELTRRAEPAMAAERRVRAQMATPKTVATVPAPVTATPSAVAALGRTREPHLLIVASRSLPSDVIEKVRGRKGIAAVEVIDAAQVALGDRRVATVGVDPSTFRAYTPEKTASSDRLWRSVADGSVAVSFGLGTDGGMALGSSVGSGDRKLRVSALATMGLGAIDAVVSRQTARLLGIPQSNALVVNAPGVDSTKLRKALLTDLPRGVQVVVAKPAFVAPVKKPMRSGGSFLSAGQIRMALTAAAGKLGAPYVWGAEGPDAFDCSGLIQWAFAQAGVRLPRVTHQQWASGPQVPFSQIQPGDLLFWRLDPTDPAYISHAAIYWGDGKMIQAPRTGDVVKLIPVHTRNLAGVIRVGQAAAERAR